MPGCNTHSNNASNSNNAADQEFLRMQRNADNMLFVMIGMVATWLAVLVISLIELEV
jgi:hypothetical protein